jgi:hypothetical protein
MRRPSFNSSTFVTAMFVSPSLAAISATVSLVFLVFSYTVMDKLQLLICIARRHLSRSTTIVLSGVDGAVAVGIKRIKEVGGITVA